MEQTVQEARKKGYTETLFGRRRPIPELLSGNFRIRQAGWEIVHFPQMTIFHHSSTTGSDEMLSRQMAFARRQYMAKHFGRAHRTAGTLALAVGYAMRAISPGRSPDRRKRRASARTAL